MLWKNFDLILAFQRGVWDGQRVSGGKKLAYYLLGNYHFCWLLTGT
jgi:hypothetical protein